MTKLKFDRTINVVLEGKEEVRVPKDELWKVSLTGGNLQINYFTATDPNARYSYIPGDILGGVLQSLIITWEILVQLQESLLKSSIRNIAKGVTFA